MSIKWDWGNILTDLDTRPVELAAIWFCSLSFKALSTQEQSSWYWGEKKPKQTGNIQTNIVPPPAPAIPLVILFHFPSSEHISTLLRTFRKNGFCFPRVTWKGALFIAVH